MNFRCGSCGRIDMGCVRGWCYTYGRPQAAPTQEQVEQVARAVSCADDWSGLFKDGDPETEHCREHYRKLARAAIAALSGE